MSSIFYYIPTVDNEPTSDDELRKFASGGHKLADIVLDPSGPLDQ